MAPVGVIAKDGTMRPMVFAVATATMSPQRSSPLRISRQAYAATFRQPPGNATTAQSGKRAESRTTRNIFGTFRRGGDDTPFGKG